MDQTQHLGIIGVGELAEFVLRGLRRAGDHRPVHLSPRNATRASLLARQCQATVAADNQAVLDAAGIILVAVAPKDAYATIKALHWQKQHVLICVAIDVTLAGLQASAPEATIVRAMPSSCLAVNKGATPLYPDEPRSHALFARIAEVVALPSEAEFETAAAFASYYLWSFAVLDAVAEQAIEDGLPAPVARRLAASLSGGAAAVVANSLDQPAAATLDRYALPGTMTLQGLEALKAGNGLDPWGIAMKIAIDRMRAGTAPEKAQQG